MRRTALILTLLLMVVITAFAHSGGTDGNGGHYDRSTGKYHYHHGYSAHQHPDGICPYDNKNKTKNNTGSSAASFAASLTALKAQTPKPTTKAVLNPSNSSSSVRTSTANPYYSRILQPAEPISEPTTFPAIPFAIIEFGLIMLLLTAYKRISSKLHQAQQENSSLYKKMSDQTSYYDHLLHTTQVTKTESTELNSLKSELESSKSLLSSASSRCRDLESQLGKKNHELKKATDSVRKLEAQVANLKKQCDRRAYYESHSLRDLSGMPDDTEIGADGWPKEKIRQGWGPKYTRYVYSANSEKYHSADCQYAVKPVHVFDTSLPQHRCFYCHPDVLPDRTWFDRYNDLSYFYKKHGYTPLPDNIIKFSLNPSASDLPVTDSEKSLNHHP